jgi:hypothetical protein
VAAAAAAGQTKIRGSNAGTTGSGRFLPNSSSRLLEQPSAKPTRFLSKKPKHMHQLAHEAINGVQFKTVGGGARKRGGINVQRLKRAISGTNYCFYFHPNHQRHNLQNC